MWSVSVCASKEALRGEHFLLWNTSKTVLQMPHITTRINDIGINILRRFFTSIDHLRFRKAVYANMCDILLYLFTARAWIA